MVQRKYILIYITVVSPSIPLITPYQDGIKRVVDKARDYENLEVFSSYLRIQYYIVKTYEFIFSNDTYKGIYEEVRLDGKDDLLNRSYGTCEKVFEDLIQVTMRYSWRFVSYDECKTMFTSTWNHQDSFHNVSTYLYTLLVWLYGTPKYNLSFIIEHEQLKVYLPNSHGGGDVNQFVTFQNNPGMIVGTQLFTAIEGPTYVTVMIPPANHNNLPIFFLMGEHHGPTGAPGTCTGAQNSFTNPGGCKARVDDEIFYDAFNSISSYERPTDMTIEQFLPKEMHEYIANFELPSNEAVSDILSLQSQLDGAGIIHRINLRFYPCFFRAQRSSQKFANAVPKCPDSVRFQYADIRMPSSSNKFFENIFGCMTQFLLYANYQVLLDYCKTITDGQATRDIIDVFVRAIYCMTMLIWDGTAAHTSIDTVANSFVDAISLEGPSQYSMLAKQFAKLSLPIHNSQNWIVNQWKKSVKLYMYPHHFDFNLIRQSSKYFCALWGHLFNDLGFTNAKSYYANNKPFFDLIECCQTGAGIYDRDTCQKKLKSRITTLFVDAMSPMLDLYYLLRCFKQRTSVDTSVDIQQPWIQMSYFGAAHTVNIQRILMEQPFNYNIEFDSLPRYLPETKMAYIYGTSLPRTVHINQTINMNTL